MTGIYRRAIAILSLGYILFLLLRTAVFSITGLIEIRYVLLFLIVVTWVAAIFRSSDFQLLDRFHVIVLGLLAWASLSASWSLDVSRTLDRIPSYVLIAIVLLLIWDSMRDERRVLHGMQVYVLASAVLCLLTILNAAMGVQYLPGRYSGGGYNPNVLATPVALSIPLAWYLFTRQGRWAQPRALVVANLGYVPIALLVIVLTASRQAMVAVVVGLSYIAWDLQRGSRFWTVRKYSVLLVLFVSVGLFAVPEEVITRLASIPREVFSGDLGTRLRQWTAGYALFAAHPFTGVGSGAFRTTIDTLIGYEVAPDNTYLTVLYEHGLIGAGLFFVAIVRTLGIVWQFERIPTRGLWLSILCMLALFWLVNDWFASPTVWILLGLLVTHAREVTPSPRLDDESRRTDTDTTDSLGYAPDDPFAR